MSETARDPFPGVTTAGRLLIILTIIFSCGLFGSIVLWVNEHGPTGNYPIAFFLCVMPPVVAVFFGLGTLVLRLLGLKFRKPDAKNMVQQSTAPNTSQPIPSQPNSTPSGAGHINRVELLTVADCFLIEGAGTGRRARFLCARWLEESRRHGRSDEARRTPV